MDGWRGASSGPLPTTGLPRSEYLYVDLGTWSGTCSTGSLLAANAFAPFPFSVGLTENLLRAGVNFKFR